VPRAAELTPVPRIHVVAGILRDQDGRVLIAERPPGKHGAGFWEFPGGKVGPGELPGEALARELHEELGVQVDAAEPFTSLDHDYPDRHVRLDFWHVRRYRGEPEPRERQRLRWVAVGELGEAGLLPADAPVVALLAAERSAG
jgi:8-oxo-dGTP diphosphatase